MRAWPPRHRLRPSVVSRRRVLLARVLAGLTLAGFAIGLVFTFLASSIRPPGAGDPLGDIGFVLSFAMFPVIGYVLAIRRPENSIGWLMLGIGTFFGLTAILTSLGEYLLYSGDRDPGPRVDRVRFAELGTDRGAARHVPPPTVPRRASPFTAVAMVRVGARRRAHGGLLRDPARSGADGGLAGPGRRRTRSVSRRSVRSSNAAQALILVIPIGVIASLTSLVMRFRRSTGVERLQLRWLLTAAVFVAVLYSGAMLASLGSSWGGEGDPGWITLLQNDRDPVVRADPDRDRCVDPALPAVRHRRRDQQGGAVRSARGVHHDRVRRDRRRRGRARRQPGRARCCRPRPRRSSRSRSSRSGDGRSGSPTGSSTASARRPTRCSRSSPSGSGNATRTRSCCRGWRARWGRARARLAQTCGSGSARSSGRRRSGRRTRAPLPARPVASSDEPPSSASSLFEPVRHRGRAPRRPRRSRSRRASRSRRPRRSSSGISPRRPGS